MYWIISVAMPARAGYMGCVDYFADAGGAGNNLEVLLPADAGAGELYDFTNPVTGTNGADGESDTFTLRAAQAATGMALTAPMNSEVDALRVDADQLAASGIAADDILVVSDCNRSTVFEVTGANAGQISHGTAFSYKFGREGRSLATVYAATESAVFIRCT